MFCKYTLRAILASIFHYRINQLHESHGEELQSNDASRLGNLIAYYI